MNFIRKTIRSISSFVTSIVRKIDQFLTKCVRRVSVPAHHKLRAIQDIVAGETQGRLGWQNHGSGFHTAFNVVAIAFLTMVNTVLLSLDAVLLSFNNLTVVQVMIAALIGAAITKTVVVGQGILIATASGQLGLFGWVVSAIFVYWMLSSSPVQPRRNVKPQATAKGDLAVAV